jgi:tRNA(Glu) U13 pseudouridine synthase TruD
VGAISARYSLVFASDRPGGISLLQIEAHFSACPQNLVGQGANNHVGALQQISRNMRSLFLHALQSYLWNKAASHRVETYGMEEVQVGDLVLPLTADIQIPGESLKSQGARVST